MTVGARRIGEEGEEPRTKAQHVDGDGREGGSKRVASVTADVA